MGTVSQNRPNFFYAEPPTSASPWGRVLGPEGIAVDFIKTAWHADQIAFQLNLKLSAEAREFRKRLVLTPSELLTRKPDHPGNLIMEAR